MRDLLPDLPGRLRASTVVVGSQPSGWLGSLLPAILVKKRPAGSTSVLDVDQTTRAAFWSGTDVLTRSLSQCIGEVTANEQLGARLFGWLGTASSLLGMIGTYGLAALLVFSRRHELAVRAALGATFARLRSAVRWACGRDCLGRYGSRSHDHSWAVAHGSGIGSRTWGDQRLELHFCDSGGSGEWCGVRRGWNACDSANPHSGHAQR
jgi:hypothetical protein